MQAVDPVALSPHWPAACPGEKSDRRRWRQSPHRPCSQGESGPHNPPSAQTPPRKKEGAGEVRRWLPAHCLFSAPSLPVGWKTPLRLIVPLRGHFFPAECRGALLQCRFFTAWPSLCVCVMQSYSNIEYQVVKSWEVDLFTLCLQNFERLNWQIIVR